MKTTKQPNNRNTIYNAFLFSLLAIMLTILIMPTAVAIPNIFNVQGRLTDDTNTIVTGNYDFVFRIYDASTGGSINWEETHSSQAVIQGIFNIEIGDVNTAMTLNELDFNSTKWLDITIDGETQTPRKKLTSIGTAMRAQVANDLNSSGDSNATNIRVSGNTFLNALFTSTIQAIGDANFVNIGTSGTYFSGAGSIDYNGTDWVFTG